MQEGIHKDKPSTKQNIYFSSILNLSTPRRKGRKKETTASTLHNYFKTIKMFCEVNWYNRSIEEDSKRSSKMKKICR